MLTEFQTRSLMRSGVWQKLAKKNTSASAVENDEVKQEWKSWRKDVSESFRARNFTSDLIAGLTVAAVALPLNIALAIASGLPATVGLTAGAVGGVIAAFFGGSKLQITGPAAALSTLVFGLVAQFGPVGAAAAALIAGLTQMLMCAFGTGRFIQKVPEAVLAGFVTGVGLKLIFTQLPIAFGLGLSVPEFFTKLTTQTWLQSVSWMSFLCGLFLAFILLAFRRFPKFPAAIVGLMVITFVSIELSWDVARVGSLTLSSIDFMFPKLESTSLWLSLIVAAVPLGILAGAESLISARSIDSMVKGMRHQPNIELFGQGLANVASGLTGGMPVSGVIVRSSVNVYSGAKTRLAGIYHGLLLTIAALFFGPELQHIPLAALAGMLCVIGFRLVDFKTAIEVVTHHRMQFLPFAISAAGAVSGHITSGLVVSLLVYFVSDLLARKFKPKILSKMQEKGIRGQLTHEPKLNVSSPQRFIVHEASESWLTHVSAYPEVSPRAFVHPSAALIGRIVISDRVHIAADTSIRADEGTPFFIGCDTNVQDGVVFHALKSRWVDINGKRWAIFLGERCSVAHQALVHGPCYVGDDCFIGFKAVVHDAIVNNGCYIGIGAVVVGVEVPERRFVPHGMVVDSQQKADELPSVSEQHSHFNEDVVEVNIGLVSAYRSAYRTENSLSKKSEPRSLEASQLIEVF